MRKTRIINLFAGPGSGKSTLAGSLFARMKEEGYSVELVREYVKNWAYENKPVNKYDQIYITGKQCHAESLLYGKVDYIITDCPVLQGAAYDKKYNKHPQVQEFIRSHLLNLEDDGIESLNVFVTRHKAYIQDGRYEDEKAAIKMDELIKDYIYSHNLSIFYTSGDVHTMTSSVINMIRLW